MRQHPEHTHDEMRHRHAWPVGHPLRWCGRLAAAAGVVWLLVNVVAYLVLWSAITTFCGA